MGNYKILFKSSANKELNALPKKTILRIVRAIDSLARQPRPPGSVKLAGADLYRIRQGDYRILYRIEDAVLVVYVVKVGHRREVYR